MMGDPQATRRGIALGHLEDLPLQLGRLLVGMRGLRRRRGAKPLVPYFSKASLIS